MLYPLIVVPGRVNGALHETLREEELMNDEKKSLTKDKEPETVKGNQHFMNICLKIIILYVKIITSMHEVKTKNKRKKNYEICLHFKIFSSIFSSQTLVQSEQLLYSSHPLVIHQLHSVSQCCYIVMIQ